MMKRIIALLLALILTVGLLPTVALATEGDTPVAGTSSDVKNGYYEGTTWKEGTLNQGTLPTGVESVSKTAKKVEGEENKYEVTLEVVLKKTESQENPGSAATVLVLDHSGSMNGCAYCKSTTDDGVNYYHTQGCKYDKPHQWVRVTSGQSRMSAATKAVKDFIKTYSGRFDENGKETTTTNLNLGRWVCLVWFNETGGVTGGGKWVDVSNKSGYQSATNTSSWRAHDGTNLDCGLRLADHWLKQSPVASINKSLKNVIVLSDGEPTYYLTDEAGWFGLEKKDITIGNKDYYVRGDGGSCDEETYNTTKSTAATLRNSASVYTVCFGVADNYMDYGDITIGNYLKYKIATPAKAGTEEKFAYDASNANELNTAFAAITHTIVSGLNTGTVKDSLPTGIKVSEADKQKFGTGTWELNSKAFNKTEETKQLADGTKETVYTYTKTYTVTIDPDDENLVKTEDGYAPLNGKTTLTVKNSQGTDVEIPFPIPAGKVTMPSYTVTGTIDNNGAVTGSGQTVNAGGSSAAMTFTPAAGYKIISVKEKVGEVETTITDFAETGYTYPVKNDIRANITVDVKTAKRSDLSYTVRYLEKGTTNEIRTADTVNGQEFSATITGDSINHPAITGFIYDSCSPESITIGTDSAQNVITLYYTRDSYTVTFKDGANGAVFEDETQQVEYGKAIPSHADPVRPGYNFTGWTSEPANYQPGTGTMPANNITFTAQWTEKGSVTINYFAKTGGTVTSASETLNPDTGTAAGSTATPNADYAFAGWYSDLECTEAKKVGSNVDFTPTKPEGGWVTTTYYAKFVPSTVTFDLNTLITKKFEAAADSKPIPDGSYTFKAEIVEADSSFGELKEGAKYEGTVTLNAADTASFDFGDNRYLKLAAGPHYYRVSEIGGTATTTMGEITYDNQVHYMTIKVKNDGTVEEVKVEKQLPAPYSLAVENAVEFEGNNHITFTNTYFEKKDPNSVTVDFSQLVCKKLTVTGSKAFTGATFEAVLDGEWHDLPTALSLEDASAIATYAHATPGAAQLHKTLTVSFDANDDLTQNKAFTGSITFNAEGVYTYTLKEVIPEGATGYDTSEFLIQLWIKANSDAKLEVKSVKIKYNNQWEDLNGIILFENTIDTGRDDYIPIIIPTIINKDTGMLNKTDHFAYVIGYPDGTVHPNGQITRAEVATIFFRLLRDEVRDGAFTTSNTYSDVAYGKWYNNPISTMSALGIITGYPDGTFKPNKPITRAEFAAIAARFDETQSGKSATFSDVIGHWAAKEIGIAYYNDWIKGYPDGTFKPDQNITRAEAMTLINRVLERKPESPADLLTNMNKWTDNMDTSKWYYLDVQEATNSHGYTRKTFNYELWRQMLPDPDWSRYER